MFAYIKGKVTYKSTDYFIIETNGIGYKIFSSLSTLDKLEVNTKEFKIYTYLYVREDVINLYGFLSSEELRVFELLITVSGIGPKAANSILSVLSPSQFSLAVITGDVKALKSIPGIGLKTAQRIILELKDKLRTEEAIEKAELTKLDDNISEAVCALQVLGYSAVEAVRALKSIDTENLSLEEMIKRALKTLSK